MKQKQNVQFMFTNKLVDDKMEYRILLTATIDYVKFLL